MATAYIMDFAGGTAEQYDAVIEEMGLAGDAQAPEGALFHGAGPTETGWRVVDVWDDAAAFDRFAAEQIGPITAKHGLEPPVIEALGVHQIRRGSDETVSFVQIVRIPGLDRAGFENLDSHVVPGDLPEELVFHVNGPTGDGVYVIDYWTTKAAREDFLENRIKPGVQAAGVTAMPSFEELELHNSIQTIATAAHA